MTYKLIALDIDGTIRSNDYPLSQRVRDAVQAAHEAGAMVTLVTGRMLRSALAAVQGMPIHTPVITFQGAIIADPATRAVLWRQPLTMEMVHDALDALHSWETEVVAHFGDDVHVNRDSEWAAAYSTRNEAVVHFTPNLRTLAEHGVTRLLAVGPEAAVSDLNRRLMTSHAERLQITRSLPFMCEILHPDAGKHNALVRLASMLDVRPEETVVFGNGWEDLPMMKWAGLGVAVGDGHPDLIAGADLVAPRLDQDGVAQVIKELLRAGKIG